MEFVRSLFSAKKEPSLTPQQKEIFQLIRGLAYDELIQLLARAGPDLNFSEHIGQKVTPLLLAINSGNDEFRAKGRTDVAYKITHLLLQHGASPDSQDGSGRTPLMAACHWNLPALVDLLLDSAANIDLPTAKSPFLNPLYVCLFKRRLAIARILVEKGASIRRVLDLQQANLKEQQGFNLDPAALEWVLRLVNKKKAVCLLQSLQEQDRAILPRQLQHEFIS